MFLCLNLLAFVVEKAAPKRMKGPGKWPRAEARGPGAKGCSQGLLSRDHCRAEALGGGRCHCTHSIDCSLCFVCEPKRLWWQVGKGAEGRQEFPLLEPRAQAGSHCPSSMFTLGRPQPSRWLSLSPLPCPYSLGQIPFPSP